MSPLRSAASGSHWSRVLPALVGLLVLAGCSSGTDGAPVPPSPQTPPPTVAAATPSTAPTPSAVPGPPAAPSSSSLPPVLGGSAPTAVRIPAIGTDSPLLALGLRDDGSLEVPPGDPGAPAAWYDGSPTPGERGPAVLLGHINATDGGPGVFAGLRDLRPGDTVEIPREDGSTAVFSVERGEHYGKDVFPTLKVYGNTAGAELRLITCDGYDPATGTFGDNYVVYARLTR